MPAFVELEMIHEGGGERELERFDLEDGKQRIALIVGLGNQIFDELRATAHTVEGAMLFAALVRAGGYEVCAEAAPGIASRLGKAGDICLNTPSPLVWLSSITTAGERVELPAASEAGTPPAANRLDQGVGGQAAGSRPPDSPADILEAKGRQNLPRMLKFLCLTLAVLLLADMAMIASGLVAMPEADPSTRSFIVGTGVAAIVIAALVLALLVAFAKRVRNSMAWLQAFVIANAVVVIAGSIFFDQSSQDLSLSEAMDMARSWSEALVCIALALVLRRDESKTWFAPSES